MIIDLSRGAKRKDYFETPTQAEIVRGIIALPFSAEALIAGYNVEIVAAGTSNRKLGDLLTGKPGTFDPLAVAEQVEDLGDNQLLVLPEESYISAEEARQAVVYDTRRLVNLDSIAVRKRLLGEKRAGTHPFPQEVKRRYRLSPEIVIGAALDLLREGKESVGSGHMSCYSWRGTNGARRVASLYRCIQGAELRAFQNVAYYCLEIPKIEEELRTGIDEDGKRLGVRDRTLRIERLRRYQRYREDPVLEAVFSSLDVSDTDLVSVDSHFNDYTGWHIHVPSRSKPGEQHLVTLYNTPSLRYLDRRRNKQFARVWELWGSTTSKDAIYRSKRRSPDSSGIDLLFDASMVAAMHTLQSYLKKGPHRMEVQPFLIPTPEMMDFYHKLTHQTVAVRTDRGKFEARPLNATTIENIMWRRLMLLPWEQSFTTEMRVLHEGARLDGYNPDRDPQRYLVQFR